MRITFCLAAMILFLCSNEAVFAADADNGSRLAERWCAACHIVSNTQRNGNDGAMPFASIARKADFNAEKLAFFLLEPHPKMPNMALSRDAVHDIAAFIAKQQQ